MLFWLAAALIVLLALGAILRPFLRGGDAGETRAAYDVAIYKDQLAEIESDLARGVLSEAEAKASRTEISRRLLAAADAEERERAAGRAPAGVNRAAGVTVAALVVVGTLGTYAVIGVPGAEDQPLAERLADRAEARAQRPTQAEAEAIVLAELGAPQPSPDLVPEDVERLTELVAQLEEILVQRPMDITGHRLLASSYMQLGRLAEARGAQDRVLDLLGEAATAEDYAQTAEFRILAAGGYVSPQAERALAEGLQRDPSNPVMRYYSGRVLAQNGEPELALRLWSDLLDEGPADAPWIRAIEEEIGGVAAAAALGRIERGEDFDLGPGSLPPSQAPPGPSAEDMEAAETMTDEEQAAMIRGMVEGLSARLANEGGTPEEWARLIRALTVLGERDRAEAILAEARTAFAATPGALAPVEAVAAEFGLTGDAP
ncbi:MAG: c-type cytochrome biogenesis protein CcmI [Rubricella sp.]